MSDIREFYFVDRKTNELLLKKKVRGIDLMVDSEEFECLTTAHNFKAAPKSRRSLLLTEKIRSLIFIKTTCHIIRSEIEHQFSSAELENIPVISANRPQFLRLMKEERALLLTRLTEAEESMVDTVLAAQEYFKLVADVQKIRDNVIIGNYSPLERQRKIESGNY